MILAYASAEKSNFPNDVLQANATIIEQTGATLGERMFNAFEFVFADEEFSDAAVVMIGTDSPTFPADFIEQAFHFLETDADIVLGKTEDGGFYLIGLKANNVGIFENVAWSSSSVFGQTAKNAARLGLRLAQILAWYDVDTPDAFFSLQNELFTDEKARQFAPKTYQWLKYNAETPTK